jgi:UDP-2,4-diacetamido-2,4,6-trideoxy-beta-L-altropyranose hydrolase
MVSKRIAIRTDANSEIGTGHFMRCLTLADELKRHGAEVCFIARGLPVHLKQMLQEKNFVFHALPENIITECIEELQHSRWLKTSQHQDAVQTLKLLVNCFFDWIIVDHYAIDHRWETQIRVAAKKILVIDDLADRLHDCDVLLDQNFYHDAQTRYFDKVPYHCQLLLGPAYALLREEFREMRKQVKPRTGEVHNVLVFFGGVDAENLTGITLKALISLNLNLHIAVVIGQQHPKTLEIKNLCKSHHFELHIQTNQIAYLMAQADLAIGAGGSSIWERFCLGLPSICISTADNQRQQLVDLKLDGLIIASEHYLNAIEFLDQTLLLIKSESSFQEAMSKKIYQLVDGYGAIKVGRQIFLQDIEMRLASKLDSKNIFAWRNHPTIRSNSFFPNKIQWAEHEKWFDQRCGQFNHPILIGEIENKPIGVVRFEIRENFAEVSIYLVPNSGNHGLGKNLLIEGERWLKLNHPNVVMVHALVLKENTSSKKLFTNLHYVQRADTTPLEFVKQL